MKYKPVVIYEADACDCEVYLRANLAGIAHCIDQYILDSMGSDIPTPLCMAEETTIIAGCMVQEGVRITLASNPSSPVTPEHLMKWATGMAVYLLRNACYRSKPHAYITDGVTARWATLSPTDHMKEVIRDKTPDAPMEYERWKKAIRKWTYNRNPTLFDELDFSDVTPGKHQQEAPQE